jgi:hypothetical protein
MSEAERTRNCTSCAFAIRHQFEPPQIGSELKCQNMPPQLVLIPNAGALSLVSMFPTVTEKMICHQHRMREEIANAPSQNSRENWSPNS